MRPYIHCSIIYNSHDLEVAQCPSVVEWIKKLWYIYTMGHYWAVKKGISSQMDLFSEMRPSEKDKYCMISPICGI